jgi:hypothetical protein
MAFRQWSADNRLDFHAFEDLPAAAQSKVVQMAQALKTARLQAAVEPKALDIW